jgi:hypothetical protein
MDSNYLIIVMVFAFIFWLKPQEQPNDDLQTSSEKFAKQEAGQIMPTMLSTTQAQSFSSKSQQDTQVNCQIRVDRSNHLIVNEQTKDCFEYFITQYGEKRLIKSKWISCLYQSQL